MSDLVFYTNPSSRGRIVRWLLEELGEPYETVVLGYNTTMKDPEYLAINPMGKVPAIRHGGTIVTESAAICAYLADAFPEKSLAPPPAARGAYYRWLFFAAGPVEAAVTNKSQGYAPGKKQMLGYGSFEDTMNALERAVSAGPYLCDGRFTAADVYVASQIAWGMMFKLIDRRPAFRDYMTPLIARPAAERARKLDDAALAEMRPWTAQDKEPG